MKSLAKKFLATQRKEINRTHRHPRSATPVKNQGSCDRCWIICCALTIRYLVFLVQYPNIHLWDDFRISAQELLNMIIFFYYERINMILIDEWWCYPCHELQAYKFFKRFGLSFQFQRPFVSYRYQVLIFTYLYI